MADKKVKEQDGRLVATTAVNIDGVSYQKGEYVDTSSLSDEQLKYYVDSEILWTATQWTGKYKTEPVDHEDTTAQFPQPQGTMTTAQGAAAVQVNDPALTREGAVSPATESGQTPEEREAAKAPPAKK